MRNRSICVLLGCLLVGCSSQPLLPMQMISHQQTLYLKSPAQIIVRQTFNPRKENCGTIRSRLPVKISRRDQKRINLEVRCEETGYLISQTHQFLPVGKYSVSVSWARKRYSPQSAKVHLKYRFADFNSGEDSNAQGADALEKDQKLQGELSYYQGDQTDWIKLAGNNTSLTLAFFPNSRASTAEIFTVTDGIPTQRIGVLPAGKPQQVSLGTEEVYVRIRAEPMSQPVAYTLARKDGSLKKKIPVRVVDCYPVGPQLSVAVLVVSEGVQVNDGIVISATDNAGKRHRLGKCTITSINGTEASCQLPRGMNQEWTEFRADGLYAGGKV